MPLFTPPTTTESSDDRLFGRFRYTVGVSVLWNGATFEQVPYPWLGEIAELVEGETWFQGGRTYAVDDATADLLEASGFSVVEEGQE